MLSCGARRSAALLPPKQSCSAHRRAELGLGAFQRVIASYSSVVASKNSSPDLRSVRSAIEPLSITRTFATRPASKPKAHTGQATPRPRALKKVNPAKQSKKSTKSKSKSKRAKAKPKPQVKPKKPKKALTPEESQKKLIAELRKAALRKPKTLPNSIFVVLQSEIGKETHSLSSHQASQKEKSLTPEEREHYNHIAHTNKDKNQAAYKSWIESHTPDQIRIANNARRRLTKLGVRGYASKLVDSRIPKQPVSPNNLFLKDRYKSGDMNGIAFKDAAQMIMREWKELSQPGKQKYIDESARDKSRYMADYKRVFGKEPRAAAAPAA